MKNQKNNIKNFRSKLAIFLAILLVLNIAPLPESAGKGMASFVAENLTNLQRAVGSRINSVFAADDKDYLLKDALGTFEVNLSSGGASKEPFTISTDTATLNLLSVLKTPPKTSQAVSGAKIKLNDSSENVVKAEVIPAANGDST